MDQSTAQEAIVRFSKTCYDVQLKCVVKNAAWNRIMKFRINGTKYFEKSVPTTICPQGKRLEYYSATVYNKQVDKTYYCYLENCKFIGLPVPIPIIDHKICSQKSQSKPEIKWCLFRILVYFKNGERETCGV